MRSEGAPAKKYKSVDVTSVEKLISVIVPTYNYATLVTRALDSVMTQWSDDIELIVVNDGSTDETPKVLNDYVLCYPQVQVVHQNNAGPAAARNHGVRLASGRYALMLDADDALLPNALDVLRRAHKFNPDAGMVLAGYQSVFPDGRERLQLPSPVAGLPVQLIRRYLLEKKITISHSCSLFRRDLLLKHPYPENLRSSEDIPVFAYLLVSAPVACVRQPVARIYKHGASLRNQRKNEEAFMLEIVHEVFDGLPAECQCLRRRYEAQRYLSLFRAAFLADNKTKAREFFRRSIALSPVQALRWAYVRKALKLWLVR
jgi:glycosyltransferase involved in cell wall biosynthesis